jgi:MraZ protein
VFQGISKINMDPKGRVAMPARYREHLMDASGGRIVATVSVFEPCLWLYPIQEWEQVRAKLQTLPTANAESRRILRLLLGHATDLELDGSGRILLPQVLRDFAQLDKQVSLVGQINKFELWSDDAWAGALSAPSTGELPEQIVDMVF